MMDVSFFHLWEMKEEQESPTSTNKLTTRTDRRTHLAKFLMICQIMNTERPLEILKLTEKYLIKRIIFANFIVIII